MLDERTVLDQLEDGQIALPPLLIRMSDRDFAVKLGGRVQVADALMEVRWGDQNYRFIAECKASSTPKAVRYAVDQAVELAEASGAYPLVVVPWLSPEQLGELERRRVSGIDLCGNGVVIVPGKVLVFRTGRPNAYPESRPIRNVYRGDSSIVARMFLLKAQFNSVNEVWEAIRDRGGSVALSTVSKVLKRLEDDLVISREGKGARLLQPEKLMMNLASNYSRPAEAARFVGRCELSEGELLARMGRVAGDSKGRVVLTGVSSATRYAAMARGSLLSFYCEREPRELLDLAGIRAEETTRFANVELVQTNESTVYFDRRIGPAGTFASPVQTWVELAAASDKRLREVAEQVERLILRELGKAVPNGR